MNLKEKLTYFANTIFAILHILFILVFSYSRGKAKAVLRRQASSDLIG